MKLVILVLFTSFIFGETHANSGRRLACSGTTVQHGVTHQTGCTAGQRYVHACDGAAGQTGGPVADYAACNDIASIACANGGNWCTAGNYFETWLENHIPEGCVIFASGEVVWNGAAGTNSGAKDCEDFQCICIQPTTFANCNTGPHACTPAGLTLIASPADTDCSGAAASTCTNTLCCDAIKCSTHTCTVAGNVLIAAAATTDCDETNGCADAECCESACAGQSGCDLRKCQLQNGLENTACPS